jgi:filamentous hemagglutinin
MARTGAKKCVKAARAPVGAPGKGLSQAEQRAVGKIDNIIKDHLKPSGISGAVRDALGNPVPKPGGGYWNHMQEVNEALRGLRNQAKALEGVADPAAQAARQRALDAIEQVEEATKGLGI